VTKQKGDVAEAYVTYLLKLRGFNVLIPWGEDNRFDLVTEKKGVFKKVQVKYVSSKNGILEVPLRSANNYKIIHYSPQDIDIIAAYEPITNKVYFIPLKSVRNRSSYKLRLVAAKNNQKKNISMASDYEARFDFFEK
jgi:Holliday junction resolvase-like predicted endonuclease